MKKRQWVFALFKSISLRNRSLSKARWFCCKKHKIGKGNLCLTENRFSRNEMWCTVDNDSYTCHITIIIYGICNAPLPKDTKCRKQYNNKNKRNRLRIKVNFKTRLEYGDRISTADVNGDGVQFQGGSHWKGSVTSTFVASGNLEVETVVSACFNRAFAWSFNSKACINVPRQSPFSDL